MLTHTTAERNARAIARSRALLSSMTVDEKLAQLCAVWAHDLLTDGDFNADRASALLGHGTGHVTRIAASTTLRPNEVARAINAIQRHLMEHTRLKIPAIVHEESCAGFTARDATQFPQALGLAATFNPPMVQRIAEIIREQMRAVGATQTLAPVLDVARDPRWGRCEETFGEDPYLVSRMGVAYVRGVQGGDLREGVAATGKHFMGYGLSEAGHNWGPSFLPRRELLERVLPPFEAAIREASIASIMNGYQENDGIPCGADRALLTDLLREELGFGGVVVADYFTVICLMAYHRVAASKQGAGIAALTAGIDVELPVGDCYGEPLKEALAEGKLSIDAVDRAVLRVLTMKHELGLFEKPYVDVDRAAEVYDTPAQRQLARVAAQQSLVLLQNRDAALPLDAKALKRVAVIGPNADSARHLQGDYHYPTHLEIVFGPIPDAGFKLHEADLKAAPLVPGAPSDPVDLTPCFTPHVTLLAGIKAALGSGVEVTHSVGCDLRDDDRSNIAQAVECARVADVAIVAVGCRSGLPNGCTSGEGNDAAEVTLSAAQVELVRRVAATGTKTIVVVISGRPLALTPIVDCANAIAISFCPGEEGGHGIADVLFGATSPSGRLPMTLPRHSGQLPLYYNHKPSGARSQFYGDYTDMPAAPLFPFGHGLSYARFTYNEVTLSNTAPNVTDVIEVSLSVKNVSGVDADEVVQLYVQDLIGSVTRPVLELKGFARVMLAAGQERRVSFTLDLKQLAFYDVAMRWVVEPGFTTILVGASSEDIRERVSFETQGAATVVERGHTLPTTARVE